MIPSLTLAHQKMSSPSLATLMSLWRRKDVTSLYSEVHVSERHLLSLKDDFCLSEMRARLCEARLSHLCFGKFVFKKKILADFQNKYKNDFIDYI